MKVLSNERTKQLAGQNNWSLAYAQGNIDGETARRAGKGIARHVLVGIDEYSLGFRAGYFERHMIEAAVADGARYAGISVLRASNR